MKKDYGIIDVWMQHSSRRPSPTSEPSPSASPRPNPLQRWTRKERTEEATRDPYSMETPIAAMDEAGVQIGLLCAWWGPSGPMTTNEDVAEHVQKYPDRFVGVAAVDLYRPMDAIRELRRCVHELGFKALRIVQWVWNLPSTNRYYYPLYAECIELGIPVCLQVGHTGPFRPSETGRPIPYIDEVALDFPELTIVCGHIGYPWTQEMIAVAMKHVNVYIDTSAYISKRYPKELVDYMKGNGKSKVLFGTNYGMLTPEWCLRDLDTLELGDEVERLFLRDNAIRVFKLEAE